MDKDARIAELERELADAKELLLDFGKHVGELEDRLETAEETIGELEAQVADACAQRREAQLELQAAKLMTLVHEGCMDEAAKTIDALKQELAER